MEQHTNSGKPAIIFLVGMPAVGKSFWGEKIAAAHKLHFVDLDMVIAEQEKESIPGLFALYGEEGFRKIERTHLERTVATAITDTVVACGGGTPCFYDNMELMKQAGTVVYLEADVPFLMENMKHTAQARPLLDETKDLSSTLGSLLGDRKVFYEQAQHILSAKTISLTTFEEIISSCISRH